MRLAPAPKLIVPLALLTAALVSLTGGTRVVSAGNEPGVYGVRAPHDGKSVIVMSSHDGERSENLRVEARDGKVVIETDADENRAWLGILFSTEGQSVVVSGVADDSPAEAAGLRKGDVIETVNGNPASRDAVLGKPLDSFHPGDRITLRGQRDGKPFETTARLAPHPGRMEVQVDDGEWPFAMGGQSLRGLGELQALHDLDALKGLEALKGLRVPCPPGSGDDCFGQAFAFGNWNRPRLGVMVEPMSDQLARYFGTEPGRGILVMDTVGGSAAEQAGILAGDVLLNIDGEEIASAGDIGEALEDVEAGESVDVRVLRRGHEETFSVKVDRSPAAMGWSGDQLRTRAAVAEALERAHAEAGRAGIDADAARAMADELKLHLEQLRQAAPRAPSADDDDDSSSTKSKTKVKVKSKDKSSAPAPPAPGPNGRRSRML